MKRFAFFTLLGLIVFSPLTAQSPPVREEQLIYSVLAFNGKDYSSTFCREESDSIYLIAGEDNFLNIRKTFVYFWPITEDWRIDSSILNIEFDGTLELRDGENVELLEKKRYTYYNRAGKYELNWGVATGEKAEAVREEYQASLRRYEERVEEYQNMNMARQRLISELTEKIGELRDQGQDVSGLIERLRNIPEPKKPERPQDFVVPPTSIKTGYQINLDPGRYQVRFINPDGTIMEHSEKEIVVFEKQRADTVGYEIIPGDRWTRPVASSSPSSVLYLDGTSDIYLRPFLQDEYNDLAYNKLIDNDAKGNPNISSWVRLQQIPDSRIRISGTGEGELIQTEEQFYVDQIEGASLGYKIIPFTEELEEAEKKPSIIAVHIPLSETSKALSFNLLDEDDSIIPDSSRQVRVITSDSPGTLIFLLVFLPLLVMVVALALRSRKYAD